MNLIKKLLGKNDSEEDEFERIPIDDLSGEETQVALEYLELLDREATRKNIEWAAYQLQADEVPLVSPIESLEERETLDKKLVAPRAMERHPEFQVRQEKITQIMTVTGFPRKVNLGWLVPLTIADVNLRLSLHITPRDPAMPTAGRRSEGDFAILAVRPRRHTPATWPSLRFGWASRPR